MNVFNKLNIQRIVNDEEKNKIYQTSEFLLNTKGIRYDDILYLLETTMADGMNYYVIHNYELIKGQQKKLPGSAVITGKKDIINFVSNELDDNDITEIRILPYHNQEYCIFISEHEIAYLYGEQELS